jgi:hypothetical protein
MSGERSAIPEPPTTTMRFKLGFVLLVPLLLLASAVKSGVDELGFRLLRAKTTGEVIEYEFKEDGKLLAYVYTLDDSESGPNVRFEHLTPRFQVFSYKWRLEGQTLYLLMGKNEMKVDSAGWNFSTTSTLTLGRILLRPSRRSRPSRGAKPTGSRPIFVSCSAPLSVLPARQLPRGLNKERGGCAALTGAGVTPCDKRCFRWDIGKRRPGCLVVTGRTMR